MADQFYVYRIYFPISGKCYIGQTKNLRQRLLSHLDSKYLIGNALRKYRDWKVFVLHTCKSHDEACKIEIEEIRNFNSVAPNGYNLTRGGDGARGYKHTEEWKKENSERMQGNKYGKGGARSKTFQGRKHSVESGKKIGNANSKRIWSEESKNKSSRSHKGQIVGNKNPSKNPITVLKQRIGRLKYHISKLEGSV